MNKKAILSPKSHAVWLAVEPGGPPRPWASAGSDPPSGVGPNTGNRVSMPHVCPIFRR